MLLSEQDCIVNHPNKNRFVREKERREGETERGCCISNDYINIINVIENVNL
jgi:hypothetical protein